MTDQEKRPVIVVGVDGSPSSVEALRWAVHQARAVSAEVRAVAAWAVPATFGYESVSAEIDWSASARKALEYALEEVGVSDESTPIISEVTRGHPVKVLIEASHTADLLVVGSRGHGAVVGMLLGSVSQHCVNHAECPVVVVRAKAG